MKTKKLTETEYKASIIRYALQDMLDDIPRGGKIDLDTFEKGVEDVIKASYSKEVNRINRKGSI